MFSFLSSSQWYCVINLILCKHQCTVFHLLSFIHLTKHLNHKTKLYVSVEKGTANPYGWNSHHHQNWKFSPKMHRSWILLCTLMFSLTNSKSLLQHHYISTFRICTHLTNISLFDTLAFILIIEGFFPHIIINECPMSI